jgi:hypothetical protein
MKTSDEKCDKSVILENLMVATAGKVKKFVGV